MQKSNYLLLLFHALPLLIKKNNHTDIYKHTKFGNTVSSTTFKPCRSVGQIYWKLAGHWCEHACMHFKLIYPTFILSPWFSRTAASSEAISIHFVLSLCKEKVMDLLQGHTLHFQYSCLSILKLYIYYYNFIITQWLPNLHM